MKTILYIILVSSLVTLLFLAYLTLKEVHTPNGTPATGHPRLRCVSQFDIGHRLIGETFNLEIELANDGDQSLNVFSLKSSCGCLQASLVGEIASDGLGITIRPNQTALIRMSIQLKSDRTPVTVSFRTNDPDSPTRTISVTTGPFLGISFSPNSVAFPVTVCGHSATRTVDVYYHGPDSVSFESIGTQKGEFQAHFQAHATEQSGQKEMLRYLGTIFVDLKKDSPQFVSDTIQLSIRRSGHVVHASFSAVAQVKSLVSIIPDTVHLPKHSEDSQVWDSSIVVQLNDGNLIESISFFTLIPPSLLYLFNPTHLNDFGLYQFLLIRILLNEEPSRDLTPEN